MFCSNIVTCECFRFLQLILAGSDSNNILLKKSIHLNGCLNNENFFFFFLVFWFWKTFLFVIKLCFCEYKSRTENLVVISPDDYIKTYFHVSTTIMEVLTSFVKHPMKINPNLHNNFCVIKWKIMNVLVDISRYLFEQKIILNFLFYAKKDT